DRALAAAIGDLADLAVLRGGAGGEDEAAALAVVIERLGVGHAQRGDRGDAVGGGGDAVHGAADLLGRGALVAVVLLVPGDRLAAARNHRAVHQHPLL